MSFKVRYFKDTALDISNYKTCRELYNAYGRCFVFRIVDKLLPDDDTPLDKVVKDGAILIKEWNSDLQFKFNKAVENAFQEEILQPDQENCPWNEGDYRKAILKGDFKWVKFLRENACPNIGYAVEEAARNGRIDFLEYFWTHGCPKDLSAIVAAVETNRLNVLKWLHEHGWRLSSENACRTAAKYGHLDCLEHLRENGYRCGYYTYLSAVSGGQLECIKWLHKQGCPFTRDKDAFFGRNCLISAAAVNGHLDCLEYLHEVLGIGYIARFCDKPSPNCAEYLNKHECCGKCRHKQ